MNASYVFCTVLRHLTPLTRGRTSWIAVGMALSLTFTLATQARAGAVVLGSTATTNLGTNLGSGVNVTNQSGLSANYVSGTTDFDSYVATTTHNSAVPANIWSFAPKTGYIAFDLGASHTVDALALWALNGASPVAIRQFSLYADTDTDPTNPGTLLGTFNAVNAGGSPVPAQVFSFADTTTQFIQLQVLTNAGESGKSGFGEVAFRGVSTVPEPSLVTNLIAAMGGLVLAASVKRVVAARAR